MSSTTTEETIADEIMALVSRKYELPHLATNESVSVPNLDGASHSLDIIATTLAHRFAVQSARLRRLRNGLLPISQLPEDVLRFIFKLHMETSGEDYFCTRRAKIASVSFSWHAFIDRTPFFWSVYTHFLPPRVLEETVSKSKSYPLTFFTKPNHPQDESFWKIIVPHVDRCRKIHVFAEPSIFDMLNQQLPTLEDLTICGFDPIHGYGNAYSSFQPSYTYQHYPRLKYIHLERLSLPWTAPPFANLTTIDLRLIKSISLSVLLKTLEDSPSLTELRLAQLNIDRTGDTEVLPKISLRQLRILEIDNLDSGVVEALLKSLRLEPASLDQLRVAMSEPEILRHRGLPSYFVDPISKLILRTGHFTINASYTTQWDLTYFSLSTATCEIGNLNLEGLKWWLIILDEQKIVPSGLVLFGHVPLRGILGALQSHPSITHVSVDYDGATTSFLEAICEPFPDGRWPLPKLSVIAFSVVGSIWSLSRILPRLSLRPNASQVSRVSSLTYQNLRTASSTVSELARISHVLGGCKIYRSYAGELYEEGPINVSSSEKPKDLFGNGSND